MQFLQVLWTFPNFPIIERMSGELTEETLYYSLIHLFRGMDMRVLETSKALSSLTCWIADYKMLSINLTTEPTNSFLAKTFLLLAWIDHVVGNPPFPLTVSFDGKTASPFKAVIIPAAPVMDLIRGSL